MGQLGELAKKLKSEKDASSKPITIIGGGTTSTPTDPQAEAKRKEDARAKEVADARAKAEASMKGLAKSATRK